MPTSSRIWFFRIFSILLGTAIAFLTAEVGLGLLSDHISKSEQMAPGLIRHDPDLGWRLTPGWSGTHTTFDYTTSYSTDVRGFRQSDVGQNNVRRRVLVLGDSFVFGLGVANSETFVSCLNRTTTDVAFVNGGIPGYSPDQVMLWAPTARLLSRSTEELLFVYLGNDLIDIGEDFPFQAPYAKPSAALNQQGELVILNQPVPAELKAGGPGQITADMIGGDAQPLFPRSQIMRLLREAGLGRANVNEAAIIEAIEPKLALFSAVLNRIRAQGENPLTLVILPGASATQTTGTLSGIYQQHLREQLLSLARAENLPTIDLLEALSKGPLGQGKELYFVNDGHLTSSGHERVCETLRGYYNASTIGQQD